MDEEFDTSVDTSDVDTSADMDTSDVVDDALEDILKMYWRTFLKIYDDEPVIEEDDLSRISEVPEGEPEVSEDDLSRIFRRCTEYLPR